MRARVCVSPEVVQDGIERQAVCPAGGEVEHVDTVIVPGAVSHPAQQNLLAVSLLKTGHHILHNIFNLNTHTVNTSL